jgi:hypothetical protein
LTALLRRHFVLVTLLAACFAPAGFAQQSQAPARELRVLFIGNSFTYFNDMPAMVAALAASQKKRFVHQSVVFPNFSLQDHWEKGDAQRAIAKGKWDFVVLQQGPSALEESRQSLFDYTRRFSKLIRDAGATPALYMVWPSKARFRDFDRVVESYALAAREVQGIILPVGVAWQEAWKLDANLPLYGEDQFHPSPTGSYLAALVIYRALFKDSSQGLPASLNLQSNTPKRVGVSPKEAALLQKAASRVYYRLWLDGRW